ncbi:MAG: DedA family protein [bacterium]|nr:DedA family protein [bacterium]
MMQSLIENYNYVGYILVLLGTFLEGETILIMAGFAAHQGYLHMSLVIMAAFAGSLAGDQLYFYLGRRHGQAILAKRPSWQARVNKVEKMMERYRVLVILAYRFFYGTRSITPFAIGLSRTPARLFIPLNILVVLVWSFVISILGFLFGNIAQLIIKDIKHFEHHILLVIAIVGLVGWIIHMLLKPRAKKDDHRPPTADR